MDAGVEWGRLQKGIAQHWTRPPLMFEEPLDADGAISAAAGFGVTVVMASPAKSGGSAVEDSIELRRKGGG